MPLRTLGPKSRCESVTPGEAGCHVVRTLGQPCGEALVTRNGTLEVDPPTPVQLSEDAAPADSQGAFL